MSVLAYLFHYFLSNSGTVEASEVTHHGKGANLALLQTGFYYLGPSGFKRNQKDPTHQLVVRAHSGLEYAHTTW